jgi:rubredoxin
VARYRCPGCGYTYDEKVGDTHEGFAPGTPWEKVPDDWACADCAVRDKTDFVKVEEGSAAS